MTIEPYYVDVACGVLAVALLILGWKRGFVRMAGSLVSLAVSIIVSLWGIHWLEDIVGIPFSTNVIWLVFAFLIIAVLMSSILNLAIKALDLVRRLLSIVPGVGFLNRLGGAFVGAVEAAVIILVVAYLNFFLIRDEQVNLVLNESQMMVVASGILASTGIISK